MGFNEAEQASMERTTIGFHLALAQDQVSTLYPDPPTAFESYEDVVQRLVPYHIWQTCDEELEGQEGESEEKRKEKVDRGKSDFRLPFPSSPQLLRALRAYTRADHTRREGGNEYTRAHD
jgi:hypothetical protein